MQRMGRKQVVLPAREDRKGKTALAWIDRIQIIPTEEGEKGSTFMMEAVFARGVSLKNVSLLGHDSAIHRGND